MTTANRDKVLGEHLTRQYPFKVYSDPGGGYVITFPDLPGCMTQVETIEEVGLAAEEIRRLWIETEYEAGDPIPLPTSIPSYSGKFNVRVPRSLHRRLAQLAETEGVSLNQCIVSLLSRAPAPELLEEASRPATEEVQRECAHRWSIETDESGSSQGVCKRCGSRKAFLNYSQRKALTRTVKPRTPSATASRGISATSKSYRLT